MQAVPVVEVSNINKHFGEGSARVDALRDVTVDVYPGTVVGLRGPSGSGKSTLLNVIGCILEPNSGQLTLNGEKVYDGRWLHQDLRRLRLEKIGFIFQSHTISCRSSMPGRMLLSPISWPARARQKQNPVRRSF